MDMQNVKDLSIPEGNVRTIHDSTGNLLWGRVAYDTKYAGNTIQDGTPTPDVPIPVQTVTGEQMVEVHGKNLLGLDNFSGSFSSNQYTEFGNILDIKSTYGVAASLVASLDSFKYTKTTGYDSNQGWKFKGLRPNTNYTISCNYSITSASLRSTYLFGYYRAVSGNSLTQSFTTDGNGEKEFTLQFYGSAQNDIVELTNLMVEEGSTASAYESYQSQEYMVNLTSKNLFNLVAGNPPNGTYDPTTYTYTSSTRAGVSTWTQKLLAESGDYTFSCSSISNAELRYCFSDQNLSAASDIITLAAGTPDSIVTGGNKTVTNTDNAKYLYVTFRTAINGTTATIVKPMLEKGSTPTTYKSYYNYELAKIGDYQDYIYKSGDDWYVHKEIGKITLNGTETWTWNQYGALQPKYARTTDYTLPAQLAVNVKCSHFTPINNTDSIVLFQNSIRIQANRIDFDFTVATQPADLPDVLSWLSSNQPKVYYVLASATDTQITDTTLIGQLNAIHEWLTRYGYQATVSGNLPMIIGRTNL